MTASTSCHWRIEPTVDAAAARLRRMPIGNIMHSFYRPTADLGQLSHPQSRA